MLLVLKLVLFKRYTVTLVLNSSESFRGGARVLGQNTSYWKIGWVDPKHCHFSKF